MSSYFNIETTESGAARAARCLIQRDSPDGLRHSATIARWAAARVCALLVTLALVGWCVKPLHGQISFREQIAPILQEHCVACHGAAGEGGVGPNLTDQYWMHGGGVKNIFKTIKYGVPAKGMIAWEAQLNPAQMQQVSSFILTLAGTEPADGKAPQGDIWVDGATATDTTAAPTDTTAAAAATDSTGTASAR